MADLVTRLLLNSSQFDNNIRKSTLQVQSFQNAGKDITATIGKVAGVLGVAMTAGEAFNKVLNSSQTLGDMTASNMAALKTSVDEFFYSLGSGNLSNFLTGLGDIIDKAKEAYAALDQLGNTKISYGVFSAKNQSEIADAQYIAKNKFAPVDQRNAAFTQWKAALDSQAQNNVALQQDLLNSAAKAVEASSLQGVKVTLDDMLRAFQTDLQPLNRDKARETAKRVYNAHMAYSNAPGRTKEEIAADAEARRQHLVNYAMLEKMEDKTLENTAAQIQLYYQLNSALKSTAREYNETANEYNNSMAKMEGFKPVESLEGFKVFTGTTTNKTEVKVPVKPVIPAGSLAELDAQIAAVRNELNLAISNEDRIRINAELNALTAQKRVIEFLYKYPNAPTGKLDGKPASLTGTVSKPKIPTPLPKVENPITDKNTKRNNEYAQSLGAIASVMSSVTNMTNDGAAAWLSWGANVLSAVAVAIPQIQALTTAKKGEAVASGIASAAQTPLVGWLLAGAAAAAVLAALVSVPSYSTGGIFAGNSTIGDMNLARVNAGEMILNNRQQRNLFNLLNSNGASGGAAGGLVEFKIKGKELVGVLNNYSNKLSKI